ncbi:MAG: SDR family NAD(P)-dependent oxidoreductase [Halieaceae bacterium]
MAESNKVALVTGASAGIGKAVVQQLLADGYVVYGVARRLENMAELEQKEGGDSPLSVIADTISKALEANKPKTRYVKGKMAAPLLFLRRWTSDRMFDRIVKAAI